MSDSSEKFNQMVIYLDFFVQPFKLQIVEFYF
jgi:hypothetical protein